MQTARASRAGRAKAVYVRNPRLYITTEPWLTRWLIGHENSFLHKKVLFRL